MEELHEGSHGGEQKLVFAPESSRLLMININRFRLVEIKFVGRKVCLYFFDTLAFVYIEARFEGAFSLVAAMVSIFLESHRSIFHVDCHMNGQKCRNLLSELLILPGLMVAINGKSAAYACF